MKNSKKTVKIVLIMVAFFVVIFVVGLLSEPIYGNQIARKPWLMQFENGPVTITFVKAPPGKDMIVDARLISVEALGLVLRLPKDRDKFYPFANIISVDPK